MSIVHVVSHPLVAHKLTLMRAKETSTRDFRVLLEEVAMLLAYEATRDLPMKQVRIETPLTPMDAPRLDGKKLVLVSVLRAGDGMLAGFSKVIPSARVGHIGLRRDHDTKQAIEYVVSLPADLHERDVIVLDPMLATGNSAISALRRIHERGARSTKLVCLIAAPEGVAAVHAAFPHVTIWTAALDERLDENAYIVPGLGDAGDRLFGTK